MAITADDIRTRLREEIGSAGIRVAADALGVYAMTIYRVLDGGDVPDSILNAFGLERGYRNGQARAISAERLRVRVFDLAREHGGFDKAGQALKLPGATLYYFATGRKPPTPRVVKALGYETVYFPKKTETK